MICERAPDTPVQVKQQIEDLLKERFFVPVLRSNDSSVQPTIGIPFTPANMPKFNNDPLSPSMEIKAYAGPMTSDQAQTFRKRWKTPPRLIPSASPGFNTSFSPRNAAERSPVNSQMSKSLTEVASSTPNFKKKLFHGCPDNDEEMLLDNLNGDSNGNLKIVSNGILSEHEEDEYRELFDDLLDTKLQMEREKENEHHEKQNLFKGYRNPLPMLETPIRAKHDSNSNHISNNFNSKFMNSNDSMFCNVRSGNSTALITFLDESGSVYNSDNICDSPSFKEKNIRLTDVDKGLEKIGRELAREYKFGWNEYWDFLGRYVDIRNDDGLECFERYLKQKEKQNELNESRVEDISPSKKMNESFGLSAVCAGMYSMDLNEIAENANNKTTKNCLTSPTTSISRQSLLNGFSSQRNSLQNSPLANPYTCIEQSCRAFSKRLTSLLESESIQDQHSYEKMLLQEAFKLNLSIDNYKRDLRFKKVNFQKVHARYSFLLVWYLKKNNVEVKYLRNFTPLIHKVYALASQYTLPSGFEANKDVSKNHATCVSNFISNYIEKQNKIFNPENVDTETACIDAWNGPDITECACSLGMNPANSKHRREIRKKLYSGK